jgi:hypothetical protein
MTAITGIDRVEYALWTSWDSSPPDDLSKVTALRVTGIELPSGGIAVFTFKGQVSGGTPTQSAWDDAYVNYHADGGTYQLIPKLRVTIPDKPAVLKFKKVNHLGTALKNAVFELRTSDGDFVARATSAADGYVTFSNLERADYTVRETEAPAGYQLNETVYSIKRADFTAVYDNVEPEILTGYHYQMSVTIKNEPTPIYGELHIVNVNGEGEPIANAEFRVTQGGTNGVVYNVTTDEDGYIHFPKLLIDQATASRNVYTITQVKMPGNYVPHNTLGTVTVAVGNITLARATGKTTTDISRFPDTGLTTTVKVVNTLISVKLKLITALNPDTIARPRRQLTNTEGTPVNGITFKLYDMTLGGTGTLVESMTKTTVSGGLITYNDLKIGTLYRAEQQSLPYGYDYDGLGDSTYFKLGALGVPYLSNAAGEVEGAGVGIFDANMIMVRNIPIPGEATLKVRKLGQARGEPDVPIEGALFLVEKFDSAQGKYVDYATLTTGEGGTKTLTDLESGNYRVTELPSDTPYTKSRVVYTFTVATLGKNQSYEHTWYGTYLTPKIVKGRLVAAFNVRYTDEVEALRQAEEDILNPQEMYDGEYGVELLDGLDGAVYELAVYEGMNYRGVEPKETLTLTSGKDGTLAGFPQGFLFLEGYTYVFRETKAPDGYTLSSEPYVYQPSAERALIEGTGGKWIALKDVGITHSITLSKYASDTGAPLGGAVFTLYDAQGAPLTEYTTGSDGIIRVTGLPRGVYYMKETVAPEGYSVSAEYIRFVLQDEESGNPTPVLGAGYSDKVDDGVNAIVETQPALAGVYKVLYNNPSVWSSCVTIQKALYDKGGAEIIAMDDADAEEFSFIVTYGEDDAIYTGAYTLYLYYGDTVGSMRSTTTDGVIALKGGQRSAIFGIGDGKFTVREIIEDGGESRYKVYTLDGGEDVNKAEYIGTLSGASAPVLFKNKPAQNGGYPFTPTYVTSEEAPSSPDEPETDGETEAEPEADAGTAEGDDDGEPSLLDTHVPEKENDDGLNIGENGTARGEWGGEDERTSGPLTGERSSVFFFVMFVMSAAMCAAMVLWERRARYCEEAAPPIRERLEGLGLRLTETVAELAERCASSRLAVSAKKRFDSAYRPIASKCRAVFAPQYYITTSKRGGK